MALAQTLDQFLRKRGTYTGGLPESITAYRQMRKGVRMMSDHIWKRRLYGIIAGAALITACAASPQSQQPDVNPVGPVGGGSASVLAPFSASGHDGMDAWRADFAARAVAAGRDVEIVHATLAELRPLDLYLAENVEIARTDVASQAEFAKPIWDYVGSAVTTDRKTRGAARLDELTATFDRIEAAYGVDREAITAIWARLVVFVRSDSFCSNQKIGFI